MSNGFLSVSIFSDLHIMTWKETEAPVSTVPTVEDALIDADSLSPDLYVMNGDITNGKARDFRLAMRLLEKHCHQPLYYTMGNHEYYGYYEDPEFTCEKAQQQFCSYTKQGTIYSKQIIQNHSFFFLSTEKYSPDLKDAGWLSDTQLKWFEQEFETAKSGPVFVFFHQPINATVAKSDDTCVQSEELRKILETRDNVFFITGHTHSRMDIREQLVRQNGVCYIGGGCPHGEFPQSRWLDIGDDSVSVKLRDHRNHQWLSEFTYNIQYR
ncbi:metallophosphoesterase [Alicyclobacillus sp. SO9]|uniref:metallophosphoesterase family protein n=1 Tax=Alicyclobacillus sp. SO9 TaxID=2665646 RepID=UPI0018E8FB91|nr:metallophosphoesterase [Alicyclobacillus sp. SO9]QQE80543.1 metallophosphoesterase [Alicyclobacillus sp. SO9]